MHKLLDLHSKTIEILDPLSDAETVKGFSC